MHWIEPISSWLLLSAVFGCLALLLGTFAVSLCREPVYRIRIIYWTFAACLIAPVVRQMDFLPGVSLGVWVPPVESVSPTEIERPIMSEIAEVSSIDATPSIDRPWQDVSVAQPLAMATPEQDVSTAAVAVSPQTVPTQSWSLVSWFKPGLLMAYAALVGLMTVRLLIGLIGRSAIARRADPANSRTREILVSIGGDEARRARLLVSDRIDSPITWGVWRPTIVVPRSMETDVDSSRLRWGLAHEWSHVLRRDFGTLQIATIAKLVCFYQPLYWRLQRQLSLSQDYLADAYAVSQGESAEDYAAFLVSLARHRHTPETSVSLGIGDQKPILMHRIKVLVLSTRPFLQRDRRLPGMAIAMAAIFIMGLLGAVRLHAQASDDSLVTANANVEVSDDAATEQAAEPSAPAVTEKLTNDDKPAKALPEPITYHGNVVDRGTGEPIEGAIVEVIRELSRDPKTGQWVPLRTTEHKSDAKGKYRFTLEPEEVAQSSLYLVVDAHHPQYQSKGRSGYAHSMIRRNLENGEPPFYQTIKLSRGEAITGTILLPDGTPAADTQILAYCKAPAKHPGMSLHLGTWVNATTDKEGRFRIVAATPGDGVLWVYPKQASAMARRLGDTRGDLGSLKLNEGVRLRGQVLDTKGQPIVNVGVTFRRRGDGDSPDEFLNANAVANGIRGGALTDAEGRFETAPLPAGTYRGEVRSGFRDPTVSSPRRTRRKELTHVFAPLEVTIKEGVDHDPLEIRAAPHLVLRGRFFDSSGKPRASHQQHLFGQVDGKSFFTSSTRPGSDGWFEFRVPHGIERVRLNFTTNEHSALRWRLSPEDEWTYGIMGDVGTMEEDLTTLEIIRYKAPILLVKVLDENGEVASDFKLTSRYKAKSQDEMDGQFVMSMQGSVGFEKQADGRWRSSQMLPDEMTTITIEKEGFETEEQAITLKEDDTHELVFQLKKSDG